MYSLHRFLEPLGLNSMFLEQVANMLQEIVLESNTRVLRRFLGVHWADEMTQQGVVEQ